MRTIVSMFCGDKVFLFEPYRYGDLRVRRLVAAMVKVERNHILFVTGVGAPTALGQGAERPCVSLVTFSTKRK